MECINSVELTSALLASTRWWLEGCESCIWSAASICPSMARTHSSRSSADGAQNSQRFWSHVTIWKKSTCFTILEVRVFLNSGFFFYSKTYYQRIYARIYAPAETENYTKSSLFDWYYLFFQVFLLRKPFSDDCSIRFGRSFCCCCGTSFSNVSRKSNVETKWGINQSEIPTIMSSCLLFKCII